MNFLPAIESNSIQRLPNTSPTSSKAQKTLKRVFLSNRDVTCNDGSQAGFYLRKSLGSRRWVVFLEGGWYCYDHKSCRTRWLKMRSLMTSAQWPETRDGMKFFKDCLNFFIDFSNFIPFILFSWWHPIPISSRKPLLAQCQPRLCTIL